MKSRAVRRMNPPTALATTGRRYPLGGEESEGGRGVERGKESGRGGGGGRRRKWTGGKSRGKEGLIREREGTLPTSLTVSSTQSLHMYTYRSEYIIYKHLTSLTSCSGQCPAVPTVSQLSTLNLRLIVLAPWVWEPALPKGVAMFTRRTLPNMALTHPPIPPPLPTRWAMPQVCTGQINVGATERAFQSSGD